jgi:hypothetical protein
MTLQFELQITSCQVSEKKISCEARRPPPDLFWRYNCNKWQTISCYGLHSLVSLVQYFYAVPKRSKYAAGARMIVSSDAMHPVSSMETMETEEHQSLQIISEAGPGSVSGLTELNCQSHTSRCKLI